uniref:Peptidase S1 domain-containing protein n=1 Tax=Anopheles coluzzii TaxID=1518534 RepID=A0A6E8V8L5_ANOCL|nr:uncharacterized protein LOC120956474 [Anopheles coluzzii]
MYCSPKRFLLLLGCLQWAMQTRAQEDHLSCGRRKVKTTYLIHNGADAIAGHWPWHAAIFHQKDKHKEYACGGSILDETTILTASHCVSTLSGVISAALVTVHVGQIHLNQSSEYTQTFEAREIIINPGFSKASIIHDIALIKLRTNISMNRYVQPVCLWTMDSALELIVGRNGTIVGFGLSERDVVSEQLKQATIGVVDPYTCIASDRVVYGTHLTLEMFCGKGQNGVSACNGDSGGGMFFEVSGRWFVRGLVSFTPARGSSGLCDPLKYTVYTDVAKYVEWIKQYIDQRVLPVESDVLEVDYEEKLRLFNFGSCGVLDARSKFIPWLGAVKLPNDNRTRCMVTLISEWYAVGPAHCFNTVGVIPYILLGNVPDETTSQCTYSTNIEDCMVFEQTRKIQRIIVHPKFGPNNSADNIALLELLTPADTSQPNVQPICMPVTPELRTNAKTNLSVVAIARRGLRQQNITVRFVEPVECTRQYAEQKIELKLEFKRMCAVQPSKREERFCYSLTEGVPIQEMKIFGGKEQYFLRGFELTGAACSTITPSIYNNIEAYVDWILYNMRYNEQEGASDGGTIITTQETLESEWEKLQPGNDKMRLFNMNTCGLIDPDSISKYFATYMPWVGILESRTVPNNEFLEERLVVLISEWYVLAPKYSVQKDFIWRYILLGQIHTFFEESRQRIEIKNVILPPSDHPRQLFALLELLEPADLTNPHIQPICLPFMDGLHRNKPAEVIMTSYHNNFGIIHANKTLKITTYQHCQPRLLHAGQLISFVTEPLCAVESSDELKHESLYSKLGSPYQLTVPYAERPRYFLYGMHVDGSYILSRLHHGPYIFHKIEKADLAWIVNSVRENEQQSSFPSKIRSERVNLRSMQHVSRSAFFNFETCGISSNSYPMPWIGDLIVGKKLISTIILISDRYVVSPATHVYSYVPNKLHATLGHETRHINDSNVQKIPIEELIVHPRYNKLNLANDIALARLATAVDTSLPNVRPICLPIIDAIRSYDLSSLFMDFYDPLLYKKQSDNAADRYIDQVECQHRWQGLMVGFTIDTSNHCVLEKRTLEDNKLVEIENGDVLYSRQRLALSDREFLRGFAVFKPDLPSIYYPAVYINTDAYLDWILETIVQRTALPFDLREELIFSE